jgi:pimeloyl-ACP methyl ester carboxylesterase
MRILLVILCCLPFVSLAQPTKPEDWGLKRFTFHDKTLGPIGFYIDTTRIHTKAPLLIDVNGSGAYPLCMLVKGDSSSSISIFFEHLVLNQVKDKYHFIVLDKPGMNFCDTIRTNEKNMGKIMSDFGPTEYYTKTLSLDWRVSAVRAVISYVIKKGFYDNSKIVVWGFSEGGQVTPKIAADDKRVTHCVAVVGSGLNQLYDPMMTIRVRVAKGEISHEQGQKEMDELLTEYREIFKDPNSTTKMFWGHTYKRWASFGKEETLESLRKLTIPIYMVVGTADNNSPIYGLDYVPLEFIRLGKNNLTYDVCTGCDHGQTIIASENKDLNGKSLYADYVTKIVAWLEK